MIYGWLLLMGLLFGWMYFKQTEAAKNPAVRAAQAQADSLEKLEKNPGDARAELGPVENTGEATAAGADSASASAASGTAERRRVTVQTKNYTIVLDALGGRIAELQMPSIDGKAVYNPVLIRAEGKGALTLSLNGQLLDGTVWETEAAGDFLNADSAPVSVSFSTTLRSGQKVKRTYAFSGDGETIRHTVVAPAGAIESYAVDWKGGLEETDRITQGQGIGLTSGYYSELVYDDGTSVQRKAFEGEKSFNVESGVVRWVGLRRKYVAVLLDFGREVPNRIDGVGKPDPKQADDAPRAYELRVAGTAEDANALNFDVKILPLKYGAIKAKGRNYEQILFTGWEWFFRADVWYVGLCGLVLRLLNLFYAWIPNYGVAIILLTLLVRFITLPLSINQTRQAAKLALHQPEIRKIQDKHKGDRQKTQQEIMAYYQKQGINPMAPLLGCFPLLLQMPVFISLFNVLGRAVELHEMPFFGWINDLSRPDVVWSGLTIPFLFPVGLTILPFFMAATMWLQMKMTIKDPNQKAMIWLMPVMMFVFSCSFPSGLVLYWTVSNLFTIAQTRVFGNVSGAPAAGKPIVTKGHPKK
jgi:YidC/Oxa1 family membrane protein insertase